MSTKNIMREQISALADGEIDLRSVDVAMEGLNDPSAREDWEIYHRIGDVLRSEELAAPFSAGFAARMAARLEAEPAHAQPERNPAVGVVEAPTWNAGLFASIRRYLMPGMVGTAALMVAVMMAPQWMGGVPASGDMSLAAQTPTENDVLVVPAAAPESMAAATPVSDSQTLVTESDIVRDPRIDQYLMAHQRFSPSAYSSSQFARSATFAVEADK